jgi:succinoglycan biosynthesis protein ExoM
VLPQVVEVGDATVLVIDNDPDASAMPLASEYPNDLVRIVHEPTPGIVAARNRALDESGGADLLVFIDDDELPDSGWLQAMIDTWQRTQAAAVAAPVISTFEEEPEPFVAAGRFFVRRRLPTGTDLTVAATGNLLLDLAQVRQAGVRFDRRFAMSGGSDTLFSRELHRRGGRMVWCDEATVVDIVPASRANRAWVLKRAIRGGNTMSRVEIVLAGSPVRAVVVRVSLVVRGIGRIAAGTARVLAGKVGRSLIHQARGARTAARGAGMVAGAFGYIRQEYSRS